MCFVQATREDKNASFQGWQFPRDQACWSRKKQLLRDPHAPAVFLIRLLKKQENVKGIKEMKCQGRWEFLANLAAPNWFKKGSLDKSSNYVKMEVFLDILNAIKYFTISMTPRDSRLCFVCSGVYSHSPLHQASIRTCR